ncbi:MAG: extracellular solute-binding protein [Chloroflexi bacterium]|nr:extracellular solute-binding protein [Chloroflexota bacterium]
MRPTQSLLLLLLGGTLAACGGQAASNSSVGSTSTSAAAQTPASLTPVAASNSAAASTSASGQPAASGAITVYGALTEENGDAFARDFQALPGGAKVNMVVGGTGVLLSRIAAEQKAGGVKADVLLLADPTAMAGFQADGLLADYQPKDAAQLPAGMRGPGWNGAFTFNNVILNRKGMASPPKDWADLKNPAYKGAIEIGDPAPSGTTLSMVDVLSRQLGWDYFRALRGQDARVVASTNTVGTDIAGGQMQVGISLDSVGRDLIKKGSPVEMVWPTSGAIPVPAPVALVKGHDSAMARAFADWLVSPAGQAEAVKLGYAPAYGPSDAIPAGAKQVAVNFDQVAKDRDSTLGTFKSIFG